MGSNDLRMEKDDTKRRADTSHSLIDIRDQSQQPICSSLINVQQYKSQRKMFLTWIKNLECLYKLDLRKLDHNQRYGKNDSRRAEHETRLLGRKVINPLNPLQRNYVAVSYTWRASSKLKESTTFARYRVQSRQTQALLRSTVRDIVLDRANKYMYYRGSKLFWIDKECIDQNDRAKKEIGMQCMDQVYGLSKFPVGLLSVRIESKEHLALLIKLLNGTFIEDLKETSMPELKPCISPVRVRKALQLLHLLTSDPWWTRAWIFQEEYRSSIRMTLLISHHPSLENQKRNAGDILGKLSGELCINSTHFREKVTVFCLGCLKRVKNGRRERNICRNVLKRAGKYSILLHKANGSGNIGICKSMSPSIFANVGDRQIKMNSDQLAIVANCCGYSTRLNSEKLRIKEGSLSLCLLALYLFNGEIIRNDEENIQAVLFNNIYDFLKKQSLSNFQPPVDQKELTFIKGCRFAAVKLLKEGIKTLGHLWKLGKVIRISELPKVLPLKKDSFDEPPRNQLRQLANDLNSGKYGSHYTGIAKDISNHLNEMLDLDEERFSKRCKDLMADEVIRAIRVGKRLRLAHLVHAIHTRQSKYVHSPYRGIFISESGEEWEENSYIFTALCRGRSPGDTNKIVSLKVSYNGLARNGLPQLITKRWMNGLFFSEDCSQRFFESRLQASGSIRY